MCVRIKITDVPPTDSVTKRIVASDITKIFDAMGWFSPVIVKMKILLQRIVFWENKVDWDDLVPNEIH